MCKADVTALKDCGVDDGEILEANQIIGYFNYVNRLLNGLGVTTDGDIVGYYQQRWRQRLNSSSSNDQLSSVSGALYHYYVIA